MVYAILSFVTGWYYTFYLRFPRPTSVKFANVLCAGGYCPFLERKGPKELPRMLTHPNSISVQCLPVFGVGFPVSARNAIIASARRTEKTPHQQRAKNLVTRMDLKCEALSKVFLVLFLQKKNSSIRPPNTVGKLHESKTNEAKATKEQFLLVTKERDIQINSIKKNTLCHQYLSDKRPRFFGPRRW